MQSKKKTSSTILHYTQHMRMLKSCLSIYKNVDMSQYTKLLALLKRLSGAMNHKQSNITEGEDINRFIQQVDDQIYLAIKVRFFMRNRSSIFCDSF